MYLIDKIKNLTINIDRYRTHSDAVIITSYYNPTKSLYRRKAFKIFYNSIKHLNHRVIECVFDGEESELKSMVKNLTIVKTNTVLWHKESLLNYLILDLPRKYQYVFWVDADVIFSNKNWLVDSVNKLQYSNMIQPFEYCIHLEPAELKPSFNVDTRYVLDNIYQHLKMIGHNRKVWKSFCYNQVEKANSDGCSEEYNTHGHVGFAWGIRRNILDIIDLYDKALVGGADHIMAHAAVGQIPHTCITKSFTDNIDEVNEWSNKFYGQVQGSVSYTPGNLYHIWHGDLAKREYLKRVKEFTIKSKNITEKDENGLYVTEDDTYVRDYLKKRDSIENESTQEVFSHPLYLDYSIRTGAIIDDMSNSDNKEDFGGGSFGGGGAGGTWNDSENFS